jgi:Flp pilus assembly protein TadG
MAMLHQLSRLGELTRRIGACRKGNSAVEFSVTMPILMVLALGAFDYGSACVESGRLNGAARAGAQASLYDPVNWDDTAQAEQSALEQYVGHALTTEQIEAMSVSAVADTFCACTGGAALDCSATCPDGSAPGRFLRVNMTRAMPLTFPYPWANGDDVTVDGQAVVRVR